MAWQQAARERLMLPAPARVPSAAASLRGERHPGHYRRLLPGHGGSGCFARGVLGEAGCRRLVAWTAGQAVAARGLERLRSGSAARRRRLAQRGPSQARLPGAFTVPVLCRAWHCRADAFAHRGVHRPAHHAAAAPSGAGCRARWGAARMFPRCRTKGRWTSAARRPHSTECRSDCGVSSRIAPACWRPSATTCALRSPRCGCAPSSSPTRTPARNCSPPSTKCRP